MIASKINAVTLKASADEIGVSIEINTLSSTGMRHRVRLYPNPVADCYTASGRRKVGDEGNAEYQREGRSGRRVHAVCWHGHRDFFRACFEVTPNAEFRTALDKWLGSDDFEKRFRASGHTNPGWAFTPMSASACRCGAVDKAIKAYKGSI